jgi:hypothetical protein
MHKFNCKIDAFRRAYLSGEIDSDIIFRCVFGWLAYVKQANTYNYRQRLIHEMNQEFIQ